MILNLPKGSINDFEQFSKAFTNHFFSSRIYTRSKDALNYIKERQNEPLRDYLYRFNAVAMEIPNLCPNVELNLIQYGFKLGHFANQIAYNKPRFMVEFRQRATCQIKLEELKEGRKAKRQQANNSVPRDKH